MYHLLWSDFIFFTCQYWKHGNIILIKKEYRGSTQYTKLPLMPGLGEVIGR